MRGSKDAKRPPAIVRRFAYKLGGRRWSPTAVAPPRVFPFAARCQPQNQPTEWGAAHRQIRIGVVSRGEAEFWHGGSSADQDRGSSCTTSPGGRARGLAGPPARRFQVLQPARTPWPGCLRPVVKPARADRRPEVGPFSLDAIAALPVSASFPSPLVRKQGQFNSLRRLLGSSVPYPNTSLLIHRLIVPALLPCPRVFAPQTAYHGI